MAEANELARSTGLPDVELTAFRPQRLALHELIIRVTANVAIMEGDEEGALGRNFRNIVSKIWEHYISPNLAAFEQTYVRLHQEVETRVSRILGNSLFPRTVSSGSHQYPINLFLRRRVQPALAEPNDVVQWRLISGFKTTGLTNDDPLQRELYRSLYRICCSIVATAGRLSSDIHFLTKLAVTHVCNNYGSKLIGEALVPLIEAAIEKEGYTRVLSQEAPIIYSLKGASAAGKSSLRPMLRRTLREQGVDPDGFATISPDIWRALLLDYAALGPAHKYAGHLTGREVALIDSKLDRFIREKASGEGAMSHLMIDRFRFDSFSSDSVQRALEVTYTKYADTLSMYFVITPPEQTVERGWCRALERGRYKSVVEFLDHSVEAYVGMPKILFKWLGYSRPHYQFYFLDNMVPKGTFPLVSAFGDRQTVTIFNPLIFVNIERYQKINTAATSPEGVYNTTEDMAVSNNVRFLKQCVARSPEVKFTNRSRETVYLHAINGSGKIVDAAAFRSALADNETYECFQSLAPLLRISLPH